MIANLCEIQKTAGLLIMLALIGQVSAAGPEVRDAAGFFSPEAVSQANTGIRALKQLYKKDLQVETFSSVPANLKDQLQKNKGKTFTEWAKNQAAKNKLDGVYALICKDPPHLEVLVDNGSLKKAFLAKDRDALRDLLVKNFRDKTYDKGLAEAVTLVRERLEQNIGPVLPSPTRNVVLDQGGFFSPEMTARISREIKEFNQRFGKDLVLETFAAPPPDKKKSLEGASAEEKTKIFKAWLHERARQAKADGIIVLFCREPARIQVEVSADTEKKAFTAKDREKLIGLLVSRFKEKQFDKALEETLDFVYDTVDRNLSPALPPAVASTLKDHAGLFSAAAVQKAERDLETLNQEFNQKVTMETFAQPPPGQAKRVESLTGEARNKFFAGWLAERTESMKGDGIHVLICKQPAHIEISLGKKIQEKAFTPANRDELAKLLGESFKAKQFDQGLVKAIDYISTTLLANTGTLAIKDEGEFFSAEAREKANAGLRELRRRFHKVVVLESFKAVPSEGAQNVDLQDTAARNKFLAAWAEGRQKAINPAGILILICKDPPALQVASDPKVFSPEERNELVKLVLGRFKEKNYDTGLTEAVAYIDRTLQKNQSAAAPVDQKQPVVVQAKEEPTTAKKIETPPAKATSAPPAKQSKFDVTWILYGLGILIALWLVIGVLRAVFGRGRPSPPSTSPSGYPTQPAGYPPQPTGYPPQRAGYPPQQSGYPPHVSATAMNTGRPPVPGGGPGYGANQGYPQQQYPGPQQGPSSGGGFLPGLMGGLFGAAAGSWMYDRFRGSPSSPAYPPVTQAPLPPAGYNQPSPSAEPGYSGAGGDFGDAAPAQPGYSSSGGDFNAAPEQTASSGGDFGQPEETTAASSGGDFGSQESPATDYSPNDVASGGDFGAAPETTESAGADFGGQGNSGYDSSSENVAGGDFGGGAESGGGDGGGSTDSTGGDFGGDGGSDNNG